MNFLSKVRLNNGVDIPILGLGTYQIGDDEAVYNAVRAAIELGYRHIDTAAAYGNETSIGRAVKESGIKREDIFITTKLWNEEQRKDNQYKAFEESLERLGVDYLDMYLIHWPVRGKYVESWKILERIYKEGRARAVGVCNFNIHHLEDIFAASNLLPAVNQVECHPWLTQVELAGYTQKQGIVFEPWSPFGVGKLLEDEKLKSIAQKYNKSTAQLILKWGLQRGFINIPKSANKDRILQNTQIFDFTVTEPDMAEIFKLNCGWRSGADPETFTF
ncbi:MAG: aldo/keto reductase [Oscillospiraceae bacterium]|nr:aldo/keto reductase [Oscillospiraceae bacterium]